MGLLCVVSVDCSDALPSFAAGIPDIEVTLATEAAGAVTKGTR